jgi:biotin operon repressor
VLLDDYVLAASAAVITAVAVVLGTLLWRYRNLVNEADKSSRLAKDVWDSVNSRFSVVDARIIDLMAKTEVLVSRSGVGGVTSHAPPPERTPSVVATASRPLEAAQVPQRDVNLGVGEGTETEARVLHLLAEGPMSSAQIKEALGRSREHTARLMKGLFDRGLVMRNDRNKPYVYEITESGRSYVAS